MKKKAVSAVIILIFIAVLFICLSNKENVSGYNLNDSNVVMESYEGEPVVRLLLSNDNKVITLKLEDYIKGVVSAEMPAEFSTEALKAQAVAARTYAVTHMGAYNGRQYDKANNIDLVDTVECQVYMDTAVRLNSWPKDKRDEYLKKINEAVDSTRGEVITYNGNVISDPFFFSCSSGKTENSEDVFSSAEPYLRSVASMEDKQAPSYEHTVKITNGEFIKKINSKYSTANLKNYKLSSQVAVISRTETGTIKKVKVGSVTMTGLQFRMLLGLSSANINMKFYGNYIEFDTRGYGHGVGMSQWGANFMGKNGDTYKTIIKHYYQGVSIDRLKYK